MQAHRKKWFNATMAFVVLLSGMWTGWGVPTTHAACVSPVIYVNADGGSDTNDGCSWESAFATLQKALDEANVGNQIWIAKGTYHPTKEAGGSGDRYRTFQMKKGVGIYGGFAGNEPETFSLADRNFTDNETILSGDFGTGHENKAYHVFYHDDLGLDESAVLDGVTITGGNANGAGHIHGGGMVNENSSPTLRNVTISGNEAFNHGGGMFNLDSNPRLTNVTISGNESGLNGGGMFNENSSPTLTNVVISGNEALDHGGGILNLDSSPILTNVTISGNEAGLYGGGMFNLDSNPRLTNVTISDNEVGLNGGGGMYNENSSPTLTNVTISGNVVDSNGGGMYNYYSSPTLTNVAISDNEAGLNGGGMYNVNSNPTLTNVTIRSNVALLYVGGGMVNQNSSPTLTNVAISGNTTSNHGGGMYNYYSSPTLTNVTISGNAASSGGGIFNSSSSLKIRNSIIWDNSTGINNVNSDVTELNSIIQDGTSMGNPMFRYSPGPSAAPTTAGDYRLQADSPAIGAGDVSFYNPGKTPDLSTIQTDIDHNPRIVNGRIDLGAYQHTVLEVISIKPFQTIQVAKGTKLEQLAFPLTARIQVEDGSEMDVPIVWDLVSTDFNPDQVGIYLLTGSIQLPGHISNPLALRAELTVKILPGSDAKLSAIYVDGTTVEGFSPGIFTYTVHVPFTTERVTVTAATYDPFADYQVIGGHLQQLHVGNNVVEIKVTAENGDEQSYKLNLEREQMLPPPAPTNLTAIAGNKSVTLNWNAVTGSGKVTYAIYQVAGTVAPANPNDWVLVQENVTSSTYTVTGLINGKSYVFAVTASNAGGTSNFSNVAIASPRAAGGRGSGNSGSGSGHLIATNGTITIPVGKSGEVRLDGEIVIKIPVGAAEQELRITIEKQLEPSSLLTDPKTLVSHVFEVSKNLGANFKKPVTLSIKFDPNKVDQNQKVGIFYYNEDKKTWIEIGGTINGQWITVEIDHFRKFAVLAVDVKQNNDKESITPQPNPRFTDIAGHWGEHSIIQAVVQQLVSGYPDGTFRPNNPVTRTEFTVMLVHALKLNGAGSGLVFTDQDKIGAWAKGAVTVARQAGIVSGYEDGSFRPDAQITRAEMALMIARALELSLDAKSTIGFSDAEAIPQWAQGAVEAIRKLDIVIGRGSNNFAPNDTATRAEAVIILLRMLEVRDP